MTAAKPLRGERTGHERMLRAELKNARRLLEKHVDTAARPYYLGVVDGLVLAMSLGGWNTDRKSP